MVRNKILGPILLANNWFMKINRLIILIGTWLSWCNRRQTLQTSTRRQWDPKMTQRHFLRPRKKESFAQKKPQQIFNQKLDFILKMHCLQIAPNKREKQQLMWRQKQNWKTFLAFQKWEFCTQKTCCLCFFSFSWNYQTMALKRELTT